MEQLMNTVSAVRADDGAIVRTSNGLAAAGEREHVRIDAALCEDVHDFAQVTEERSWLADLDGLVEGLASDAHELLGVVVDPADGVCLIEITVEACKSSHLPKLPQHE